MNVRHIAYIAAAAAMTTMATWTGTAWSTPRKAPTHAYVVRAGDEGWWHIAHVHGVTMPQLLAANHATAATPLRTGQTIQLPPAAHEASKHPKSASVKPAASATKR